MFKTRMPARLLIAVLAATAVQLLPADEPAATQNARADVPTSPVTISLTSSLREGNLVVMLDDVPIFNEKFQKPALLFSQKTTWNPLEVEAGNHTLTAKLYGTKKTYVSPTYQLEVSRTKASELRFSTKDDKLTAEVVPSAPPEAVSMLSREAR